LKPLIPIRLSAATYTQTTDIGTEINAYLTHNRKVEWMNAALLKKGHEDQVPRL